MTLGSWALKGFGESLELSTSFSGLVCTWPKPVASLGDSVAFAFADVTAVAVVGVVVGAAVAVDVVDDAAEVVDGVVPLALLPILTLLTLFLEPIL
jgi:hypothetical protein